MRYLVVCCFLVLTVTLNAQDDWVKGEIFLKDSTIMKGYLELPLEVANGLTFSGKEKVKYRKDISQKTKKYFNKDIDSVVLHNDDVYKFIRISKRKYTLCKLELKGKVTLFSRQVITGAADRTFTGTGASGRWVSNGLGQSYYPLEYYAFKSGQEFAFPLVKYSAFPPSFKKYASYFFKDCDGVATKIKDKTYTKEKVVELVTEYNKCSE